MSIIKITKNGEITLDRETNRYTVWDETYSNAVCVTRYLLIAEAALKIYTENYL